MGNWPILMLYTWESFNCHVNIAVAATFLLCHLARPWWPWPLRCPWGGHGSLHAVQQVQSDLSSRSCWLVAENGSKATGCSWFQNTLRFGMNIHVNQGHWTGVHHWWTIRHRKRFPSTMPALRSVLSWQLNKSFLQHPRSWVQFALSSSFCQMYIYIYVYKCINIYILYYISPFFRLVE